MGGPDIPRHRDNSIYQTKADIQKVNRSLNIGGLGVGQHSGYRRCGGLSSQISTLIGNGDLQLSGLASEPLDWGTVWSGD